MGLESLKTFNEIKLTKENIRHKLRFASGDIKMETNGLVSDTKNLAKSSFLQLGAGYVTSFLQNRIMRFFANRRNR